MTYGAWADGTSPLMLALWLAGFIAVLAALLALAGHQRGSSLKGV